MLKAIINIKYSVGNLMLKAIINIKSVIYQNKILGLKY